MSEDVDAGAEALVARIRSAQFPLVRGRGRDAYAPIQVDDFLDGLVVAVRQGNPVQPLVELVRFATPRVGKGYAAAEVDRFLEEVGAASAGRRLPAADEDESDPPPPLPASYTAAPGVVSEQKGLVSRLLRR